jgi:hypothetical protein
MANDEIDGLIMDTTFTVIRLYHTAVLVAVSHNVGIPLAVSFGKSESVELYDKFYTWFDKFGIKLRLYILESDQGLALISVGRRHPRHLFYLRHVLKTLRKKPCGRFGPLMGNLIRARSQKELDVLWEDYTPDFLQVCENHGQEEKQLRLALARIGLAMGQEGIAFADPERTRWRQVSMLERLDTRMPSTSNTIESLNGHMNDTTPRHNTLWGALLRIEWIFSHKIECFQDCVYHNQRYERRQVVKRLRGLPPDQMAREITFFQSEEDCCPCGQTIFASQMYRLDIPCSHRLFLMEQNHVPARQVMFPRESRDKMNRLLGQSPEDLPKCLVTYEVLSAEAVKRETSREREVQRLVRRIMGDVHAPRMASLIRDWVEANLQAGSRFALQESDVFWDVHRRGVQVFMHKRREPRKPSRGRNQVDDSDSDVEWKVPNSVRRGRPGMTPEVVERIRTRTLRRTYYRESSSDDDWDTDITE